MNRSPRRHPLFAAVARLRSSLALVMVKGVLTVTGCRSSDDGMALLHPHRPVLADPLAGKRSTVVVAGRQPGFRPWRRWSRKALLVGTTVLAWGLVGLLGGCGSSPASTTSLSPPVGIKAAYLPEVGATVLVDSRGYALYLFVPDHRDVVTCTGACAGSWPPLTVPSGARAHVGAGIDRHLVDTTADPSGGRVVTYNRWPLYTYAPDIRPGTAVGQGVDLNGGYWYLVRPDGTALVPAGDPDPGTPTP